MTEKEVLKYRNDFPIFSQSNVAYLDNAATAQRPVQVINAVNDFMKPAMQIPCAVFISLGWMPRRPMRARAKECAGF